MADLFCGAGGTSEGAEQALRSMGYTPCITAVNHWKLAVATHTANHPGARHRCASVDSLNPRELYGKTRLDGLWASPECTHHSTARGGAPVNDQSRATAWCVVRWAEALQPGIVWVENVPAFASWGPCTRGRKPRPIKSRKGETFKAFISAMVSLGYKADHKVLCAADYGDPTSRQRLFIQFVRGRREIVWPNPTHSKCSKAGLKPWRTAREIIDWDKKGRSIFNRKRPLVPNTMRRIMSGLREFGFKGCVVEWDQQSSKGGVHGLDEPVSTILTKARHGFATAYIVEFHDDKVGKARVRSLDEPLPTIDCSPRFGLADPYIIEMRGTTPQQCAASIRSVDEPLGTITAGGGHFGLCKAFLVGYYGTGHAHSIDDPVPTITTHDRYGIALPVIEWNGKKYVIDILFRMFTAGELAAATGFPSSYQFLGKNEDVVRQIGNAVPCGLARAIAAASISQDANMPLRMAGLL